MTNIGIIGHGFVGKGVEHAFKNNNTISIYDKFKETLSLKEVADRSEFLFVAVPISTRSLNVCCRVYPEDVVMRAEMRHSRSPSAR